MATSTQKFIEKLFATIANSGLSIGIKSHLLKLQYPIVSLPHKDKFFIKSKNHPARQTIDLITKLGSSPEINNEIICKIGDIVSSLIQNPEATIADFKLVASSLSELADNSSNIKDFTSTASIQLLKKSQANFVVHITTRKHLNGMAVPYKARIVALKLWPGYLKQQYINHGNDSIKWKEAVSLYKLLLNTLQPIKNQHELNLLKNTHVNIADTLQSLLNESSMNKSVISSAINSLRQAYKELMSAKIKTSISSYHTIVTDDSVLDLPPNEIEITDTVFSPLPGYVKPGIWFEVSIENQLAPKRLKLSLLLYKEAKLIFVNREGIKVVEKGVEEFAMELAENTSKIIGQNPEFNRVTDNLKTSLFGST